MRSQKNIFFKCLSYLLVLSVILSLPLGLNAFAADTLNGTVDFEKYSLGYPQTSENGILINTDKKNASNGKFSLRYGYESEVDNAMGGSFALLSFGGDKTIELKAATQYQIKLKYMLKGSTACSVDLAFFSSSALTPNSSRYRDEIGRIEKLATVTAKKNVWLEKTVSIATDKDFNSFSDQECNALAIGFYSYIDAGMGTDVYIYLDDIEIKEMGAAPTYTIKFETNGGNAVEDISGLQNRDIVLPEAPVKENCVFAGWYTDKTLTQRFNDKLFNRNLTLYAKWLSNGSYYIDFNGNGYDTPYKDSVGIQTAISYESSYSPSKSLKYRDIGAYGARRLLITEDGSRVTVKNHTLYQIKFSYRNYSQNSAYFEAVTSGASLYTGTQVFGGTFVLSKEDEWKNATYYLYTDLFSEEENYLVFYIKGDDNNKSNVFIDDIEITEVSIPQDEILMIIDHNDGENAEYLTGAEDSPLSIKEPVREGYQFVGWSEDNWYATDFTDDGFYFSKRIYAKWAKLKQIQNFDDTYDYTGISLGYDLDIEIYDTAKSGNSENNAVSKPNSLHRIGEKNLKKGFTLFDGTMEPLISDQKYLISFAVKADKINDPEGEIMLAQTRAAAYAWSCDDDNSYFITTMGDLPEGEWVRVSYIMSVYERYLAVFTTGNNSLYFDDFSIEWMPEDAEFESGESVEITQLDIENTVTGSNTGTENKENGKADNSTGASAPGTGDSRNILLPTVLALVSACGLAVTYCYISKKRRQK